MQRSCEIKGYQPNAEKMKTHSRPWNFYPCPRGLTRYGDGSACKSGSNTCDLGYVAGNPNMQRSCEIKGYQPNAAKVKTHSRPWNFYPCPHGLTRYGDGSACRSGSNTCDLGYVAGSPNKSVKRCELSGIPKICERKSSTWAIPNKQVCQTVKAATFKVETGKRYAVSVKGEMAASSSPGSRWGGGHCTYFVVDGTKKSSHQPGFKTSCNLTPTPGYTNNWSVVASSKKLPIDINWVGVVKVPEISVYTVHCKHYFEHSRPLITTLEELDC